MILRLLEVDEGEDLGGGGRGCGGDDGGREGDGDIVGGVKLDLE